MLSAKSTHIKNYVSYFYGLIGKVKRTEDYLFRHGNSFLLIYFLITKMKKMKKEQKIIPASKVTKKTGQGSNPENKFKKGKPATAAALDNIITSAVDKVKPQAGKGFTDEGTVPGYEEER